MVQGASTLTEEVTDASSLAVKTAKALVGPAPDVQAAGGAEGYRPAAQGETAFLALDLAAKFASMLRFERKLAEKCLQGDALDALNTAGVHLHDMSYVGGHLAANGVDVMTEISSAINAYDDADYYLFGKNMGAAWRKVLLSKERSHVNLPQPSSEAVEEITQSFFSSFFGRGASLQVLTDADKSAQRFIEVPPLQETADSVSASSPDAGLEPVPIAAPVPGTTQPEKVFSVDLHSCVSKNMQLFESAWAPIREILEDVEDAPSGGLGQLASDGPSINTLAMSMFDLQTALETCNIGNEKEAMLIDSLLSDSHFHTSIDLPEAKIRQDEVSKGVREAVQDWRTQRWSALGSQLGDLLRGQVLLAFPQKYAIDDMGMLRHQLLGASNFGQHTPLQGVTHANIGMFALFSGMFLSMMGLVAMRSTRRHCQRMESSFSRRDTSCSASRRAM